MPLIFDELFSNQKGKSHRELERSQQYMENEIDTLPEVKDEAFIYRFKKGKVRTFASGRETVFPVLIMELADCTVEDLIRYESRAGSRVPHEEKVKIIRETVNAVSHLHSLGVLHRDLSPDNLFAVDRGDRIAYVLGDFGAAKTLFLNSPAQKDPLQKEEADQQPGTFAGGPGAGQSSEVVGHNAYLDPNRYNKKHNRDFRLDIYSSGVIVTEILMGNFWVDILGREDIPDFPVLDFEKDVLLEFGTGEIPANLVPVLRKAVKRDIEARYKTMDRFREALFTALGTGSGKMTTPVGVGPRSTACPFYFNIKLPFEVTERTFAQEIIRYEKGKKIELPDFRGVKIVFTDFFPRRVKIKGTSFYSATISGNAVLLNFRASEFHKIEKLLGGAAEQASGELCFKGTIEIEP